MESTLQNLASENKLYSAHQTNIKNYKKLLRTSVFSVIFHILLVGGIVILFILPSKGIGIDVAGKFFQAFKIDETIVHNDGIIEYTARQAWQWAWFEFVLFFGVVTLVNLAMLFYYPSNFKPTNGSLVLNSLLFVIPIVGSTIGSMIIRRAYNKSKLIAFYQ